MILLTELYKESKTNLDLKLKNVHLFTLLKYKMEDQMEPEHLGHQQMLP